MGELMTPFYRIGLSASLLAVSTCLSLTVAKAQGDKPAADKPQTETGKKPAAESGKPPANAVRSGRDRWSIKTASDVEAQEIDRTPVKSTVEKLLAIPRPLDMPPDGSNPFFQTHRARPAETSVFSVEADVVDCRLMPDGDYRVTVKGVSGKTMVLEMPNPAPEYVDPKSKFAADLKSAREKFDTKIQPERTLKPYSGHVRLTGIGFFGRTYGDKKLDGNMIQLHPILNVEWLDKPTAEFTAPPDAPEKLPSKTPPPKLAPKKPAKRGPASGVKVPY
jgi:hypothetical protein